MSKANFGLLLPTTLVPAATLNELDAFIRAAEDLGYHSLWTLERILHPNPVLDSLTTLTHAAAITKRIGIGTSVLLAVFRNPIVLAKQLSTMDYLSNGRVTAGLSVGGRDWEFAATGLATKSRGVHLTETVKIMRALWTEPSVTYAGKWLNLKDVKMFPKPVQKPIPILIGGNTDPAIARAGRIGDGYLMTAGGTPESFKKTWSKVVAAAEQHNKNPSSLDAVKLVYTYTSNDPARAYDTLKKWADSYYMSDYDAKTNCIFGTPEQCIDLIQKYIDAGVKTFILGPPTTDVAQIQEIKDKVLSRFK
ncbi:MAG: LLM class flavin-dependent oxidoreductase [Nitrososphaerales archaeon]